MKKTTLFLLTLLLTFAGALGLSAQTKEAYYTAVNDETGEGGINTFYYDNKRSQRSNTYSLTEDGTRLHLNTGNGSTIIFDSSFADYRPTNTSHWFEGIGCGFAKFEGMENLNTSQVTDMSCMFKNFGFKMIELDLSHFDTSSATNMSEMFSGINSGNDEEDGIKDFSLDLSSFTFKSTTNTTGFLKDAKLKSLTIPASANYLASDAFERLHYDDTGYILCELIAPEGFIPQGATLTKGYMEFTWKGGIFCYYAGKVAYCKATNSINTLYYDNQYNPTSEHDFMVPDNGEKLPTATGMGYGYIFKFESSFADYRPTNTSHWFENMGGIFGAGEEFYIYGMENLNTSEVTNMSYMFSNSKYFEEEELDLSHFDTSKVTDMSYMFKGFIRKKTVEVSEEYSTYTTGALDISSFTINPSTNTNYMFKDAEISTLVIPASANYLASNACSGVGTASAPCTLIYPDGFSIEGAVQNNGYFTWKCGYFKEAVIEPYAVLSTDEKTLTFHYDGLRDSRLGKTYDMNTGKNNPRWYSKRTYIKQVIFDPSFAKARPTSCYSWFMMPNLSSITGTEYLNTSEVTNMAQMFAGCHLESIDVSHFDTSKVTAMGGMFMSTHMTSIDVSNFDTSNVTDADMGFNHMFNQTALKGLDLSNFTFNASANTSSIFIDSSSLQYLILPASVNNIGSIACYGVGTEKNPCILVIPDGVTLTDVTTGTGYFKWREGYFKEAGAKAAYAVLSTDGKTLTFCYDGLRELRKGTTFALNDYNNMPLWQQGDAEEQIRDVEKVVFDRSFADARPNTTMGWFCGMSKLKTIQGFGYLNTSEVRYMTYMFLNCESLETLDLSSFTFGSSTDTYDMLAGCSSLKSLALPASAKYLNDEALLDVGSASNPCSLSYPEGFIPQGATQQNGYFTWKGGFFEGTAPVEAYAVLTNNDTMLTFYCDNQRGSREGTSYDLNTDSNRPGWYGARMVETVVFDPSFENARPTSCYQWFYLMDALKTINGIEYLRTDDVTNMIDMFSNCSSLKSLDLSHFNTANVTSMARLFSYCTSLTSLDLSNFNTANVTDMSEMFAGCTGLTSIDVSSFKTVNVTSFNYMFSESSNLESLDLSSFTFSKGASFVKMLQNCTSLKALTVPATVGNITENACTGVGTATNPCELDYPLSIASQIDDWKSETGEGYYVLRSGYFVDMKKAYGIFYNSLEYDGNGNVLRRITFYYDNQWKERYVPQQSPGTIPASRDLYWVNLTDEEIIPTWHNTSGSSPINKAVFDESFADARPISCYQWFKNFIYVEGLEYLNTSEVRRFDEMFSGCSKLQSLDLSNFTFSQLPGGGYPPTTDMLKGCTSLTALRISSSAVNALGANASEDIGTPENPCVLFYPKGVTITKTETGSGWFKWKGGYFTDTYAYVLLSTDGKKLTFYYDNKANQRTGTTVLVNELMTKLGEAKASIQSVVFNQNFANYQPVLCYGWFLGMTNLTSITGMEYLNTSEVTDMGAMFAYCTKLTNIDLSHFDTSNLKHMDNMFMGCSSLTSIDLSHFDTSKVENYGYMFLECSGLTSIDLSNFTFRSSSYMFYTHAMFAGCDNLTKLTVPASAVNMRDNTFDGTDFYDSDDNPIYCDALGTPENPCTLIYPDGMELVKDEETDTYFKWKGGYFTDTLLGDANGDGMVSVADVMLTVNKVMNKQLTVFYQTNADVNGDGKITVADVMAIVKMVLNSGPKSAPLNAWQSMSDAMEVTAKGSELTLHLTGTGTYTASQMTLSLPEGCRLESAQMVSSRSNGHSVQTSYLGNGQYRVVIYGTTGLPFGNSCSDLVRLHVKGNHGGDVALSDIQVVDYHTNTVLLSDVSGLATGIESISTDTSHDGDWYTTQGQRVTTPTRGIYIRNGQKKAYKD